MASRKTRYLWSRRQRTIIKMTPFSNGGGEPNGSPEPYGRHSRTRDRRVAGRRRLDRLPQTTVTKKFVALAVAAIQFIYLIGEALLTGHVGCF